MIDQLIRSRIGKYCSKKDKIIVAVSGGIDSMALGHMLVLEQKKTPNCFPEIVICHLNHKLRGKESDREELIVKNFAAKYSVSFYSEKWKNPQKSENKARKARYAFLKKTKQKIGAKYIVTAHHADDQVETILLNIIRGSGIRGLIGMREVQGNVLRPMLSVSKSDILKYCKKHQLTYACSSDNKELIYKRNILRHKVIPEMRQINSNLEETILRNSSIIQELETYIKKQANKWTGQNVKKNTFPLNAFLKLPSPVQVEILLQLVDNRQDISQKQLGQLLSVLKEKKTGKQNKLKNTIFKIEYNTVRLEKETDGQTSLAIPLTHIKIPGTTKNNQLRIKTAITKNKTLKIKYQYPRHIDETIHTLDIPRQKSLFVRSWQPGDKFQPKGMKGTKKLQDFFVDRKIPASKRKTIPIFINKKTQILAIGDLHLSAKIKEKP